MKKNRRLFFKNFFSSLFLINLLFLTPFNKIQSQIKKIKNKNLIWYLDEND